MSQSWREINTSWCPSFKDIIEPRNEKKCVDSAACVRTTPEGGVMRIAMLREG